MHYFSTLSW